MKSGLTETSVEFPVWYPSADKYVRY